MRSSSKVVTSLWDRAPFVVSLRELMDKIASELFCGAFAQLTKAEMLLHTYPRRVSKDTLEKIKTFLIPES